MTIKVDSKIRQLIDLLASYTGKQKKDIITLAILNLVKEKYPELLREEVKNLIAKKVNETIQESDNKNEREEEKIRNMILQYLDILDELIKNDRVRAHFDEKSDYIYRVRFIWDDPAYQSIFKEIRKTILRYALLNRKGDVIHLISKMNDLFYFWCYREAGVANPYFLRAILKKLPEKGEEEEEWEEWEIFYHFGLVKAPFNPTEFKEETEKLRNLVIKTVQTTIRKLYDAIESGDDLEVAASIIQANLSQAIKEGVQIIWPHIQSKIEMEMEL